MRDGGREEEGTKKRGEKRKTKESSKGGGDHANQITKYTERALAESLGKKVVHHEVSGAV